MGGWVGGWVGKGRTCVAFFSSYASVGGWEGDGVFFESVENGPACKDGWMGGWVGWMEENEAV